MAEFGRFLMQLDDKYFSSLKSQAAAVSPTTSYLETLSPRVPLQPGNNGTEPDSSSSDANRSEMSTEELINAAVDSSTSVNGFATVTGDVNGVNGAAATKVVNGDVVAAAVNGAAAIEAPAVIATRYRLICDYATLVYAHS
jgi:hypothetical protein